MGHHLRSCNCKNNPVKPTFALCVPVTYDSEARQLYVLFTLSDLVVTARAHPPQGRAEYETLLVKAVQVLERKLRRTESAKQKAKKG